MTARHELYCSQAWGLDVCFVIAVCLVMSGAAVEVSYPFNGTESSSVNKS
jgi:hypothetical protein